MTPIEAFSLKTFSVSVASEDGELISDAGLARGVYAYHFDLHDVEANAYVITSEGQKIHLCYDSEKALIGQRKISVSELKRNMGRKAVGAIKSKTVRLGGISFVVRP